MKLKKKHYIFGLISVFLLFLLIGIFFNKKCEKRDYASCNLLFGGTSLKATVVYSKKAQAKGLMGVKKLKNNEGMIFVYDEPIYLSFWMKNTLIPLSIAFINEDGLVTEIYEMQVENNKKDYDLPVYQSHYLVKYAVEAPAGWFILNSINKNDRVNIPEELK